MTRRYSTTLAKSLRFVVVLVTILGAGLPVLARPIDEGSVGQAKRSAGAPVVSARAVTSPSGPAAPLATVLYVDADASPGGDGTTWNTAYRYLQDALDVTNVYSTTDYEIWVAAGVYYPDEDGDGDHVGDAVTETFALSYDNVQLYGGFDPGAGSDTWSERNWDAYATILSGDIAQDDPNADGNFIAETWDVISGTNAYHVLWLDGVTNEPISTTTVIDGFTVTAGQATGSNPHNYGGGLYCDGFGSGNACSPTLSHLSFSGNQADSLGGGMYNDGGSDGNSSPVLTDVTFGGNQAFSGGGMVNRGFNGTSSPALTDITFSGNQVDFYGGGMFNDGTSGNSSPVLTNVTFVGNQADWGGGMFNQGASGGSSSPVLTNVTFGGNQAASYGGGMLNEGYNGSSSPVLTNVTFGGNQAGTAGGGMYNRGAIGASSPVLTNVILWGNSSVSGAQIYNATATPIVSYGLVEGSGGSSSWGGILGTDGGGNIDADPRFVHPIAATAAPTTTGDYRLRCSSPAIDAGNNLSVTVTTDLDGNPRLVDGNGDGTATVDIGAYEFQGVCVYLPLAFRDWPPIIPLIDDAFAEIPTQPVGTLGETFYSTPLTLSISALPAGGAFYFSSSPDSLDPVSVDDMLVLVKDGGVIFEHNFAAGGPVVAAVVPVPRDVMTEILDGGVVLEYRDVYGTSVSATEMWLIWVP